MNTANTKRRTGLTAGTRDGFSMSETLIAMAVFAIGFVAVASIFPVGLVLQKQTADGIMAQQVARNASALLRGRKFTNTELDTNPNLNPADASRDLMVFPILRRQASGQLLELPGDLQTGPGTQWEKWKINDRSYFFSSITPQDYYYPSMSEEISGGTAAAEYSRKYYWVPLAQRTQASPAPSDWRIFVFILRGGDTGHPVYGYDRAGITANIAANPNIPVWANYDGFLGGRWNVPGVYGMGVTVSGTNRFVFDNRYGTHAASNERSSSSLEIQVGDFVLDNNGTIHTILTADATGVNVSGTIPTTPNTPDVLWYGRPAWVGQTSPTKLIVVVDDAVE